MQQWIPFLMALVAVGSLATTIYFGKRQQENANKLLSIQLRIEFDKQYESDHMRGVRRLLAETLLEDKEPRGIESVLGFFDSMGFYAQRGAIDMDTIWNEFSWDILHYWPALKDYVKQIRDKEGDSEYYEKFEWLYDQILQKTASRRHQSIKQVEPTKEQVKEFLKDEHELL